MNAGIFEKYESEVRSYCRVFPAVFAKAKGSFLYSEDGRQYIDFFCGAGGVNYGHNNSFIKKKVVDYLLNDGIVHSLDMYTTAKRDFIEFFEKNVLEPRGYNYKIQFPGPTGTNAVEAALKLVRKAKHRSNIFAFMGAFHGMTLGAISLTTDRDSRIGAGVPLTDVTHIPSPYMFDNFDVIDYMQRLIDDDHSGVSKPAAVFVETVQADGGIYVFSEDFLRRLREFCSRNDVLLVCDDVQVGSARTGWFFAFERAGIEPDVVVLSKSIGGYGLPFALVLLKPEIDVWKPGEHTGTFRGCQLSMVAAKAGLEEMLNKNVEKKVQEQSVIIRKALEEIVQFEPRFEARGIGFMWGLDCSKVKKDSVSREIIQKCFDCGLIVERAGRNNDVVKIMPDLLIDEGTLRRGLSIFVNSAKDVVQSSGC